MDLASKKLPLAIICALLAVLAVQMIIGGSEGRFVDPDTCEIWEKDRLTERRYTGEYDQRCLDLRELAP